MNQQSAMPILYSFRRCPYAMRARMAILIGQKTVRLREVVLKDKPQEMLDLSPKGTVPVLLFGDIVLEESWDVMHWALENHMDDYFNQNNPIWSDQCNLIKKNDVEFKPWLDRYKYHVGYPEYPQKYYRDQAMSFLINLDERLNTNTNLFGNNLSFADIAIFPFVRQFHFVDSNWLANSGLDNLFSWLNCQIRSDYFQAAMGKYAQWRPELANEHIFGSKKQFLCLTSPKK